MNNLFLANIVRFVLLLLAQVIVFDKINFLGFINPYPYVLFVLLYPVNGNKNNLLISSFLLGLLLDMFSNSGGIHAASSLILAYIRPVFFKFSFGLSYEYQTIKINAKLTPERFTFLITSIVSHHLVMFFLEIFRFAFIGDILLRTIASTIFTVIISIIIIYLFKPAKK
jgi:rod shape-determining protein MreD